MSGHSKWANIKRKKEINDAARSSVFTKMSRLITSAVAEGGGITDPDKNFRLRLAIDRAKAVNMPKDTIQRAIDRATGSGAQAMKEVLYEGFGPGNTGLIIVALTDNPHRTSSDVKNILDRNGGKFAPNAVAHLFQHCGVVELSKKAVREDDAWSMGEALGCSDIEDDEDAYILYVPFESVGRVRDVMGATQPSSVDVIYRPLQPIEVDADVLKKTEQLCEKLEELDDVQSVYATIAQV